MILDDPGDVLICADQAGDGIGSIVFSAGGKERARIYPTGLTTGLVNGMLAPPASGDTTGATDSANISDLIARNAINNLPIILRAGTYRVNSMIDLTRDGIEFRGSGKTRTTIIAVNSMTSVLRLKDNSLGHVSDLSIDGGGFANHELSMEHSEGTTRHTIERVRCLANTVAPVNHTAGDGTITSGSASFSSASASFASTDVGKWMIVTGAGASGANLFAQISSVTDSTHVTLDRNASTSVTTATFQYFGFPIHNNGCEDVTWFKVEAVGSEASPTNLVPMCLLSHPSGLGSLYGCDIFGPLFHDALTLEVSGSNVGPLVCVNQGGSQSKQVHVCGTWIYDGGSPTAYRPIDTATTFLCSTTLDTCHLVAASASGWCNGRLPTGNQLTLRNNVYVQSSGNSTTTMQLFSTSSGTSSTKLIVDGGKLSIGGSMTTLQLDSGGSSSHVVEIRGKIDGVSTYTGFATVASSPSVPASTTAQVNTFGAPMMVYVSGGTVSAIAVDGTSTGLTSGAFIVRPMGTITLTYSSAPSWLWQAL